MVAAYRFGLSDLKPKFLHEAFTTCLKECKFPPSVAEIRKAYELAVDNVVPFNALPAHDDSMSAEERKEVADRLAKAFPEFTRVAQGKAL